MGNEQRNYGRELHTNEFDVCQNASAVSVSDLFLSGLLCNWAFAFSWWLLALGLHGLVQAMFVSPPDVMRRENLILQEVDRPSWSRSSKEYHAFR